MRLRERELISAALVRRIFRSDALGGHPEVFSEEKIPFRASLLPEGGELQLRQYGLKGGAKLRLLADSGLAAKPGDGVYAGEGFYVVQTVNRWTAHCELVCEERA